MASAALLKMLCTLLFLQIKKGKDVAALIIELPTYPLFKRDQAIVVHILIVRNLFNINIDTDEQYINDNA